MIQFSYQGPTLAPAAPRLLSHPPVLSNHPATSAQIHPRLVPVRSKKPRTVLHVVVEPMPGSGQARPPARPSVAQGSPFAFSQQTSRRTLQGNTATLPRKIGDADIEAALDIIFPPILPPLICPDMVTGRGPAFPSSFG